ncbi:MAG: M15 family metallopeptidase [Spirochaetales bacterium]|nr:M15 family metallopeptidase [Spirochaetales bacterium]
MKIQKQQIQKRSKKTAIILPIALLCILFILFIVGFVSLQPVLTKFTEYTAGQSSAGQRNQYGLAVPVRSPYEDEAWFSDPLGLLLVVDRNTALSADYEPLDLVNLESHGVKTRHAHLQGRIVAIYDLLSMFEEAKKDSHFFYVFSSYRSYETQKETYNYWVQQLGKAEADRSSARPGHSEHQLGTTFDMSATDYKGDVFDGFDKSPAGIWLAENAWKYGFVMSYPENSEAITGYIHEPWHFRYVGRGCSKVIFELGVIPSVFIRELDVYRKSKQEEETPAHADSKLKVLGRLP